MSFVCRIAGYVTSFGFLFLAGLPLLHLGLPAPAEAAALSTGFRDFYFGTSVNSTPTGEKPESKLWWNNGFWWGSLWDPIAMRYSIHRFDVASQAWVNTGTPVDTRRGSKSDALWDGTHLYIVSHVFTTSPRPASASNSGRLYRYGYNSGTGTYSLDPGFPVVVNSSKSETLVLDKDSTGQLWVTWVEGGKVKVNRSLGNDQTWGQPFDLPIQGGGVSSDDISSVVSLASDRIGLMWSNQVDRKAYFAVHVDSDPDTSWQPREDALSDPVLGQVADDHLNLKISCDGSGNLYAAVKTGLDSSQDPLIYVLRRQPNGVWSRHVFGTRAENHTRPIICIDGDAGVAYVFAHSEVTGRGAIYVKSASLADLQFPPGLGSLFIDTPQDVEVNNPTSKKGCVGSATGLLVLASDQGTRFYLHNYLDLSGAAPVIASFSPPSGPVGTEVTILGSRLNGASEVAFNGTPASTFFVDSPTQIRAVVPAGSTSGRIRVTTPSGTALSAAIFTVVAPPTIASFNPTGGTVGTEVTILGTGFSGTTQVTFGGVPSTSFVVESDGRILAAVPMGAATGRIRVTNPEGSAESTTDFVVTPGLVFRSPHDAQVRSASPTTNYGQYPTLRVVSGDPTFLSFIKFDVAGVTSPVQEAKLRFFVVDASNQGGVVHSVSNDYLGTTTPWTENGLTWNNAPAIESAPLDSLGAISLDTWVEFDVTSAITGNGTYGFGCRSSSTNSAFFSSDEGTQPPQLVIVAPPSPGSTQQTASAPPSHVGPQLALERNQPNPFRGETRIAFHLSESAPVRLVVYDTQGRAVRRLVDSWLSSGSHTSLWDGRDAGGLSAPSGIYFLRLELPREVRTRKMLLVR